jgi:hypothetical protein
MAQNQHSGSDIGVSAEDVEAALTEALKSSAN